MTVGELKKELEKVKDDQRVVLSEREETIRYDICEVREQCGILLITFDF